MKTGDVLPILAVLFFFQSATASECGESTIPYSLEVLPSGQPILGCARPKCFGYLPNGHQMITNAQFFRIDQQSDGFLREDPLEISPFNGTDPRLFSQRHAECEREFQSLACSTDDQWVGGIAPVMNASENNLVAFKCCTYSPLRSSTDRGIATVGGGQIVFGGEVKENDKQYAFDYISNVEKKLDGQGHVFYEVNIRRFPCLDLQNVDESVAEVVNSKNIIEHVNQQKALAHQAPNVEVETPIEAGGLVAPDSVLDGQEVVVEEIVAQPGFVEPPPTQGELPPAQIQPFQQPFPQPFQQGFVQPAVQPGLGQEGLGAFQPAVQQPVEFPVAAVQPNYGFLPGLGIPAGLQMYFCFPGDAIVTQQGGATKRMDELEVGDWVHALSENGRDIHLVPVKFWIHRDPNQTAQFIEFLLDNEETFTLTEKHIVYVSECSRKTDKNIFKNPVPAKQVEVGDCFYYSHDNGNTMYSKVKILDIQTVIKTGIYSPMTSVGHILVNKIHASCHSETDNFTLQNSFFMQILEWKRIIESYFFESDPHKEGLGFSGFSTVLEIVDLIVPTKIIR